MHMAEGRLEHQSRGLWQAVDPILVMLHNVNCTAKGQALKFGHFNPWNAKVKSVAEPLTPDVVPVIKQAFGIK